MKDVEDNISELNEENEPQKKKKIPTNEHQRNIQMDDNNENISIQEPYLRMQSLFSRYASKGVSSEQFVAAMGNSFINNPFLQNARLKRINSPISSNDKKVLDKAIKNPQDNENLFKSESQALYYQNYVYSNLLRLNREIPKYFHYAIPMNVSAEDCKKDDFKKEMRFVNEILRSLNVRKTGKDIAMDVALEGKRSYVFRSSFNKNTGTVDYAVLQKLPSQWVKYTSIGSNTDYITSMDFMMFLQPGESVDFYPPFFRQIWDELVHNGIFYQDEAGNTKFNVNNVNKIKNSKNVLEIVNNRYMYWVELPQTEVFEFGADDSHSFALPEYIGLFSDLRGLDDYKWLQNQLLSKAVNSVLVGTVPLIKDHNLAGGDQVAISMDSIIGFSDMFTNAVSSNIMPFFAPFTDYKLLSLPLPPDAKEINNTALKNLINTSGMGALISTTDKPSIISVKTAQIIAESKAEYLMLQIQECLNNIINKKLNLKYKFKITVWGGSFTFEEHEKILKEMIYNGYTGLLPRLLSIEDQTIEDYVSTSNYLESVNIYDKFMPMSKITQESKNDDENQAPQKRGRKPVGDNVENDNTAISLDQGNNVSDIKEFNSMNRCIKCGTEIEENEFLCDDCLEEEYDYRIEQQMEKGQDDYTPDSN